MRVRNSVVLPFLLLAGCAARTPYDRPYVSEGIEERTDFKLGEAVEPGELNLPGEVSLSDGLSQEEAVAIALWNNALFQADLADLGIARAVLAEARFLSNPFFYLLLPVGPKGTEARLYFPLAELLQSPTRVAAAKRDAERIAENLVQHGLGLIRDVQTAYAALLSAEQKASLAGEYARVSSEIADITRARWQAGDISELEASAGTVGALRAGDAAAEASHDASVARFRLIELLGLGPDPPPFTVNQAGYGSSQSVAIDDLVESAFVARPDLRASELAIEAAGKRVGLQYLQIVNLIGIIDSKDKGEENLTTGPGFQMDIPILNQNQAGISRARAELERAVREYIAARHRIALEVQEAHAGYELAREQYERWQVFIIPALEDAARQASRAYEAGEQSYLFTLTSMRDLLEARLRLAELQAQIGGAVARLNFAVGKRIVPAGELTLDDGSRK